MNKFNVKRKTNAGKVRKTNAHLKKTHSRTKPQHQRQVQQVSGKRTGKAQKKAARQKTLKTKAAIAQGLVDVDMQSAET